MKSATALTLALLYTLTLVVDAVNHLNATALEQLSRTDEISLIKVDPAGCDKSCDVVQKVWEQTTQILGNDFTGRPYASYVRAWSLNCTEEPVLCRRLLGIMFDSNINSGPQFLVLRGANVEEKYGGGSELSLLMRFLSAATARQTFLQRKLRRDLGEGSEKARLSVTHEQLACTPLTHVRYINLAHRTERDTQMRVELAKLGFVPPSVHRIEGVQVDGHAGLVGCLLAHIRALEAAYTLGGEISLILEDDFTLLPGVEPDEFGSIVDQAKVAAKQDGNRESDWWDVILLATSGDFLPSDHPPFHWVVHSQTTTAYLIRRNYIPVLLGCWQGMIDAWNAGGRNDALVTALDQKWKVLQLEDSGRWFAYKLGMQRAGHGDIEGGYRSYGV